MTGFQFQFCGEGLIADPAGAIYWPAQSMLIVSDLHFEKGSSFAKKGIMLPPYDTSATLKTLSQLCKSYKPKTILSLGDAFHDRDAEERMDGQDVDTLQQLTHTYDWIWILGNHDPVPPRRFTGTFETDARLGPFCFRHEAEDNIEQSGEHRKELGEISGHYHPCAKILAEHRKLRRRCIVFDSTRLIMPAMGAYTGGLNVLDGAIKQFFVNEMQVLALGERDIYPIPADRLVPDAPSLRSRVKKPLCAVPQTG